MSPGPKYSRISGIRSVDLRQPIVVDEDVAVRDDVAEQIVLPGAALEGDDDIAGLGATLVTLVAAAEAARRNARAEYERFRALYENENASRSQLDAARASFESGEAQVEASRNRLELERSRLSYTTLEAPVTCDNWFLVTGPFAGKS